ncbi:MAG TPA: restriction endonuclease [Polyangiaceae bacterium]|nr:restriction endonuclease [Polyangiaceae bacterium]
MVIGDPGSALQLGPRDFERFVADVLVCMPHTAVLLGAHSKDAGVDLVVASLGDVGPTVTLVQCKRYEKRVKEGAVKGLLADVFRHAATGGLLVTSSDFSRGAGSLCAQFMWRIQLWRGVDLLTRFEDSGLTPHVLGIGRPQ